ncbi:MAG: hypothetical protein GWN84_06850 [Gammaproteobacteria bacterium]|nr:hypothetical protein [Gammaproteobacteria bacterium]NIR82944.1 hypothetical protein [Gammaproteobacteria bacterium]NIR90309.1 hypothetical protein [Gammaproteobacteria bacterium]NIU04090.1 hypothetical protein [Gammaproteobacteria bacterium]NIV51386.1 hypothetical protein [Gammaproteobacteria bacterium]
MSNPPKDKTEPAHAEPGQRLTLATKATGLFVRLVGVVLLLFGFWTATQVVLEAWNLYEDPSRVERFAVAIDQGSNIDRLLNPGASGEPRAGEVEGRERTELIEFRFSYFIAWAVVLLLLMLIGRLTIWFIRTGGELALYDVQVRRVARTLMRQAQKPEKKIS